MFMGRTMQQILLVLSEIAKQAAFSGLQVLDVTAEDLSEISLKTMQIDGVDIAAFTAKCRKLAGASAEVSAGGNLEDRLKQLINEGKVMIFMKGDRQTPRCGFSKQLIAIVNETVSV